MLSRRHGWATPTTHTVDEPLDMQRVSSRRTDARSSGSVHSGVFADDIDDHEHEGALSLHGTRAATDQKILENARFGLTKVQLRSGKTASRRASTTTHVIGSSGLQRRLRRRSSDMAISWLARAKSYRSKLNLKPLLLTLHLIDSIYIMCSVPLRLGFFFDPWNEPSHCKTWTLALSIFTVFDLFGVIVRFWVARKDFKPLFQKVFRNWVMCCLYRVQPMDKPRLLSVLRASFVGDSDMTSFRSQLSGNSTRGDRVSAADALPFTHHRRSKFSQKHAALALLANTLNCFPLEVIFIAGVGNYNLLHLVGLTRYIQAAVIAQRQFSDVILTRYRHLPLVQALSFSATAAIVYLFFAGMYLIHMAASGYMLVAHWECGIRFNQCVSSPQLPGTWVQRDRLERGILWRKYIRSLYWGSKTVTTLGQGDLVPATEAETAYRILVQFISGLWATAILTAYSFYFSRKDAKMTTNLTTRLEQSTKFLLIRRLPKTLTSRVRTYFQYMQRTRFGVEEEMTLQALPPHYHQQCLNYVKYKSFQRLAMFKNRDGAFLRTLLSSLEKDYFAPGQIIISIGEVEEMFVVAWGEINIVDANNATIGRLTPGNAYAERALFIPTSNARHTLVAETHCEVWSLRHADFKAALKKHFSKLKYASIVASNVLRMDNGASRVNSMTSDSAVRRFHVHDHSVMSKLVRKMSGDLNLSSPSPSTAANDKPQAWRLPDSQFRRIWKYVKCSLLLFQLFEVPYHIAFQRGFGVLNPSDYPNMGAIPVEFQLLDFCVCALVEIFFLVDWFFRARCFCRSIAEENSVTASTFGLIKDKSLIFRHYRENEGIRLDVLLHLPLPLIWDILPKNLFGVLTIVAVRFVRVIRLLRLRHLRELLRSIMIDHSLPPNKRLLVYVVVCCTASAHIAACIFFTLGDAGNYRGGLPVGGVEPNSITGFDCLEDATVYRNCSWYVYDRSTFNIDAPFLRALQWSVVLQSTVGYGEILSFSTRECLVGCLWIFFGANICYCTGCVLSSVLGQLKILHTIHQERMEEINLALISAPNLSENTKIMIRSYYLTKWQFNGSAARDEEVILHLPRSIRQQVRVALHVDDLRYCYVFAEDPYSPSSLFIREVARIARSEIFLKNVMVVKEGHTATEFFIMQSGAAELLLPPLVSSVSRAPAPTSSTHDRRSMVFASSQLIQRLSPLRLSWTDLDQSLTVLTPGAYQATRHGDNNAPGFHSRSSARESSRASAIYSRALKISAMDLRLPLLRRRGSSDDRLPCGKEMIPISIIQRHDCFGEESLSPPGNARTYQVNVRIVASAQVIVIKRRDLLALASRFPTEFTKISEQLDEKAEQDEVLLRALQRNFMVKEKIARLLGIPQSLYVDRTRLRSRVDHSHRWSRYLGVIDPEDAFARWWARVVGAILVYNFYVIIFRIAFLPRPSHATMRWLTAIDFVFDVILYADIFLKYGWIGYIEHGQKIMSPPCIRERYTDSWLRQDCWSMLPLFYHGDYFVMTLCRVPRILRSPQLFRILDNIQTQIQERFLRGNNTKPLGAFDLFRFVLIFVSTAHYVGSLYYLLGRVQLESGLVSSSWINVDLVLQQHPDDVVVHYMRSLYWSLSTFTVDCFGDILARNFLETIFSMCTCILGWIFIGQVIGRINVLMMSLDKEAKHHVLRIEDFDQYAKQRKLPNSLRHRALQSLMFKTECQLLLRLNEIFRDLPKALYTDLFYEMHVAALHKLREFKELSKPQLEAIASALYMEIHMPGDLIYECGRMGTKLYILKKGTAEAFSPHTGIVFCAIESGSLFGECAFFIPGAKRLASVRAVRSCQLLQLDKRKWNHLWPQELREEVEAKILAIVSETYRENARAYLSITKNFFIKNENAKPPRSLSQRMQSWRRRRSLTPRRLSLLVPAITTDAKPSSMTSPKRRLSITNKIMASFSSRPSTPAYEERRATIALDLGKSENERTGSRTGSRPGLFSGMSIGRRPGSVTPSSSPSSLQRQSSHGSVASQPSVDGKGSADSNSGLRKSSLSAFAEALGIQMSSKGRPSGVMKLPPLAAVPSERFKLARRDSKRTGIVLPKLSAATELKWKRHEKHLSAIRMFRVGIARVESDLEALEATDEARDGSRRRRASVCVAPGFVAMLDEMRAHVRAKTLPRRFSMQVNGQDMKNELLAFDAFENEEKSGISPDHKHNSDAWDDDDDDDDDVRSDRRQVTNADSSGSFTLATFVRELTGTSRRTKLNRRGSRARVAPVADRSIRKGTHEIWVPPLPGAEMFCEDSRFRQIWDSIMLFVTLYYTLVIPFRACFLHDHMDDPRFSSLVVTSFALEYALADLMCILDFILRRNHFEFVQDGEAISDKARIAANYWHEGTYVVDLMSLLPLEALACLLLYVTPSHLFNSGNFTPEGALPVWRTVAFARVNRSIRGLVHLHPLSDRLQRFILYDLKVSWLRPSICYLIRLAVDFAVGTHWIACLFFGVSYLMHEEGRPSWLTTPGMLVFDDSCKQLQDVSHVPVLTKYLRSFHFSIGAVTTVCYGDILPMNAIENTVTIGVIFVSVLLFSMLSGGFFKFFEMEFGKRADYEEKVSQVGQLMVFHQFPSRMWKQMQVYFALSWQESKGMHEEEMLRGVTNSMRREIATHVHANLLKHVKLLSTCEPRFARALLTVLQHELYVRNDVIIQRGDRGRSMYIIESGLVSIRRPEKHRKSSTSTAPPTTTQPAQSSPAPEKERERRASMAQRLRSSRVLVRDVMAAAAEAAAVAAATEAVAQEKPHPTLNLPVSPPDTVMVQAMQKGNMERVTGGSPPLRLKVAPKVTSRSASGIFTPQDIGRNLTKKSNVTIKSQRQRNEAAAAAANVATQELKFVKGPFDYFGERSLLFGTPRMATCVALCVCSLYVLTLDRYEQLLEEFPQYRRKNIQDWVMATAEPQPTLSAPEK